MAAYAFKNGQFQLLAVAPDAFDSAFMEWDGEITR